MILDFKFQPHKADALTTPPGLFKKSFLKLPPPFGVLPL